MFRRAPPVSAPRPYTIPRATSEAPRPPTNIQSLLFGRDAGWTVEKSKAWAKANGYKHGKVDVTDQYVRIRQFDPKGLKVKRTITLGRGIRAVVAREEDMATTKKKATRSPRRRRARKAAPAAPRRRRARKTSPVATASRRRPRRRHAREATVKASRRRRSKQSSYVMEASRRRSKAARSMAAKLGHRRRRATGTMSAPRRRRRHVREQHVVQARRHPRRRHTREATVVAAPRRRRRARHAREATVVAAPRRRRRSRHAREATVVKAPRRRRYHRASEAGLPSGAAAQLGKLALAVGSAGVSFIISDAIDRFLATYNPELSGDKAPKNKFTSDGTGTLANTLNVASPPHIGRIATSIGLAALPAVASIYAKNKFLKSSLEGAAVGSGVKAFSLLWTNVLMPMLKPKESDPELLKKSIVARLYPAEVAAKLNLESKTTAISGVTTAGALSGQDVGPFAGVGGSSPYPDTAEALRRQAGMGGESPYPSTAQALRAGIGDKFGIGYGQQRYGYHPQQPTIDRWRYAHPGYGGQGAAAAQWSNHWAGQNLQASAQMPGTHHHHHCMLRAKAVYPTYSDAQLHQWCRAHPHHTHPYLYETPVAPAPPTGVGGWGIGQDASTTPAPDQSAAPPAPPPPAPDQHAGPPASDAAPAPDHAGPGFVPAGPPPAPMPPAASGPPPGPPVIPPGPPAYVPGPASTTGPGSALRNRSECACLSDDNQFLGFIGDGEEKDLLFESGK